MNDLLAPYNERKSKPWSFTYCGLTVEECIEDSYVVPLAFNDAEVGRLIREGYGVTPMTTANHIIIHRPL